MQRLYERAEQSTGGVQQALAGRLQHLITQYKNDLIQAQESFVDASATESPQASTAQDDGTLTHQYAQLTRQAKAQQQQLSIQQQARQQLRTLRNELSAPALDELPVDSAQALDDEMLALEQAAQFDDQLELPLQAQDKQHQRQQLKAVKRYRQLAAQQKTESMVNRAVIARPENPGPLNPHMLAIKSLTNMRDLSLPYLNRFVSYIETVMWLEEQLTLSNSSETNKKDKAKTTKKQSNKTKK